MKIINKTKTIKEHGNQKRTHGDESKQQGKGNARRDASPSRGRKRTEMGTERKKERQEQGRKGKEREGKKEKGKTTTQRINIAPAILYSVKY